MTDEGKILNPQIRRLRKDLTDRTIPYYPSWKKVLGSSKAVIYMSQLLYWTDKPISRGRGGWFYKSAPEMEEETGLTKNEQAKIRRDLLNLGVISIKKRGIPAVNHYWVDLDRLEMMLREAMQEETLET